MSKNYELMRRISLLPEEQPKALIKREDENWTSPTPPPFNEASSEWIRALSVLGKHWKLVLLVTLICFGATAIATFLMKPVYEPTARLEIDPPGTEVFTMSGGGSGSADAEYLQTQVESLQSERIALAVIRTLHLDTNPEFAGKLAENPSSAESQPGQLSAAEKSALRKFQTNLTVKRGTGTRIVTITFASHNPLTAADVLNTFLNQYITISFEDRHNAIVQSTQWLAKQLDDIRDRMESSNRALAEFQKSAGIADVDDKQSTFSQRLADLNRQLTQAQADRVLLESYLGKTTAGDRGFLPQFRNNPLVQQLNQKLAETKTELAQMSVLYGRNHPFVIRLRRQADELERQLNLQRDAVVTELKTSFRAAKAREDMVSGHLKGATEQAGQIAHYEALKKEAQANIELYNSLYAKVKEAGISSAGKSTNIRIIDEARVLDTPTRPRTLINLLLGGAGGLFLGVIFAFVRERFDQRIQAPADLRQYVGSAGISVLPVIDGDVQQLPRVISRLSGSNGSRKPDKFLLERPHSPESEAVRGLYTSVMLSRAANPPRVLLVASSFAGEGKTTIATNLALALSKKGLTCLVDADMRQSRIAGAFGVASRPGLAEVLCRRMRLEQVAVPAPNVPNLFLVPAGKSECNAGELLCSNATPDVIRRLHQEYEFTVIDSPPLIPFADGRALSPLADGVILVGRAGKTTRTAIIRSIELLAEVRSAPILEVVLNAAEFSSDKYRYYGYGTA